MGLLLEGKYVCYVLREWLQRVVLVKLVFLLASVVIVEHRLVHRHWSPHVEIRGGRSMAEGASSNVS